MSFRIFNCTIAVLRFLLGGYCILIGGPMGWIYGTFEMWSSTMSILNLQVATHYDDSWRGLAVLVCYFCGFVFLPHVGTGDNQFLLGVGVSVAVVRTWAMVLMGRAYTGGMPTWFRLVDTGPFAVVRHPLAATGIILRWLVVMGNPTGLNLGSAVMFTCGVVLGVRLEESFLAEGETWRAYAERVKFRLIPNVY